METKLVIDIGNSLTKIACFKGDEIVEVITVKSNIFSGVSALSHQYGIPKSCLISIVKGSADDTIAELKLSGIEKTVVIRSGLRLPVKIGYKTPETLGSDRLANACGAWQLYPDKNILVVDLGTCIKYDFITLKGEYLGGAISPGLRMRYKALSHFTDQLPYFKPDTEFPDLVGQSTEGSIRSGVENGILAELDGTINRYETIYHSLIIIFTGGDHSRFADKVKSPIFVAPNLTLNGLKVILDHNDL